MNYDFLWASTITNVTTNINNILNALDISQGALPLVHGECEASKCTLR